jgi:hypothetical protein
LDNWLEWLDDWRYVAWKQAGMSLPSTGKPDFIIA